jgi:hypothetical protein
MVIITRAYLEKIRACEDAIEEFESNYPNGVSLKRLIKEWENYRDLWYLFSFSYTLLRSMYITNGMERTYEALTTCSFKEQREKSLQHLNTFEEVVTAVRKP